MQIGIDSFVAAGSRLYPLTLLEALLDNFLFAVYNRPSGSDLREATGIEYLYDPCYRKSVSQQTIASV